ncbi:MAG TPA: hypothetical protein VKE69_04090 [Planctomycetota bacterium]|nr:hypothetical protein [Planctomycetota bacterium]
MSVADDLLDLPLGETAEAAPGVRVERRCLLATIAAALAAGGLPGRARAARIDAEKDRLGFDDFLKVAIPAVKGLEADASRFGQDRYLFLLASIAMRLADAPVPEMRAQGDARTFIGVNPGGDPFTVLHWRMEPGSKIGTHAHAYGNVVTVGLEGEARIENYEVVGERDYDAKGTFRVRRTLEQVLRPGEINVVNLERNYMHGFVAGSRGARGLDLTTRILPKRPTPVFVRGKEIDSADRVYEATWGAESGNA